MAFGVIHRYPVHGDVDACTIGSAYTEGCVTDTGSRIRCGQGRRSHAQQVRNILSEVYFLSSAFPILVNAIGVFAVARVDTTCTSCRLITFKLSDSALVRAWTVMPTPNKATTLHTIFFHLAY